jgi:redox-sensitive bicupin YhaK (pirin superfamily)
MSNPTFARVARTIAGEPASDGAGVRLTRVIGGHALPDLDPFLLLDEFGTAASRPSPTCSMGACGTRTTTAMRAC